MKNSNHFSKIELSIIKDLRLSDSEAAESIGRSTKAVSNKRWSLRRQGQLEGRRGVDTQEPEDHAEFRASELRNEIRETLMGTAYPVVNTDAVRVEAYLKRSHSRREGYRVIESTPRTTISDTLRVAAVEKAAGTKWLFTGAQNDAPVHKGFWKNLQAYAKHLGAKIVVGPWTYETTWWNEVNPTSRRYASEVQNLLCFGQLAIGDNFVFCGEMNTLPTASRPISDLVTYSRGRWAVFPHAKIQLKSVPSTDPAIQAHQVMTSGACTLPKVIARKAGVKSIFHHVIGATLVEFDSAGDIFCRQINADTDGSFYDLDARVDHGRVSHRHRPTAIIYGDIHIAKADRRNLNACFFGQKSMLASLEPQLAFLHDLHDQEIGNHHRKDDVHFRHELDTRDRCSVRQEVLRSSLFLAELRKTPASKIVVVDSNHDLALERYVREGRYREYGGRNLAYGLALDLAYTEYRERVAEALDDQLPPPKFSLLEFAIRKEHDLPHVMWAYDGHSFLVDGVECGHHGFRGANGAKGTVAGFAQMGRKMSIGDKHSPEILEGVYCAGVMNLQHGYNKGPSGWATTCIVQYANGKRTLVTLQNGKWRA
jgi:hypothetical protein